MRLPLSERVCVVSAPRVCMSRRFAFSFMCRAVGVMVFLAVTPALVVAQAAPVDPPVSPTTAPASPSIESRFALLRGQPGYWRIGRTREGVWWFVDPHGRPDFLNMVTTVQPTLHGCWASPEEFSKDWDTKIGDWAAIDSWQSLPHGPARAYERLAESWVGHLAERYFRTTTTLLRQYDPNHLVLGIRYRGSAPRE